MWVLGSEHVSFARTAIFFMIKSDSKYIFKRMRKFLTYISDIIKIKLLVIIKLLGKTEFRYSGLSTYLTERPMKFGMNSLSMWDLQ